MDIHPVEYFAGWQPPPALISQPARYHRYAAALPRQMLCQVCQMLTRGRVIGAIEAVDRDDATRRLDVGPADKVIAVKAEDPAVVVVNERGLLHGDSEKLPHRLDGEPACGAVV